MHICLSGQLQGIRCPQLDTGYLWPVYALEFDTILSVDVLQNLATYPMEGKSWQDELGLSLLISDLRYEVH